MSAKSVGENTAAFRVTPVDSEQCGRIIEHTRDCLDHAARELDTSFEPVAVYFNLRGRSAGMYCVDGHERFIRYNPWLFARDLSGHLENTVPHEVAHYVVDVLYGLRSVRAHGVEWRSIMRILGAEPRARGNYDLEGVPVRRQRRFSYTCSCRRHELTTVRHRRVQNRNMKYVCRYCRDELVYMPGAC